MDYTVRLEQFEGPLDLLLYLIKKQEINIYDIPIAKITEQYLEYLRAMEFLNLELAGEFLVMAATLMRIKAKMLLPRPEDVDAEEIDPRRELVQQLLEYQKFREAASKLEAMEYQRRLLYTRPSSNGHECYAEEPTYNLFDLIAAFKEILAKVESKPVEVTIDEVPLEVKIEEIKEVLKSKSMLAFEDLFEGKTTRLDVIVTFLALLEVLRLGYARVRQTKPFGKIWIVTSGAREDGGSKENS